MATTLIKLKQPVRELELDLDENSLEFMWISVKDHLPEKDCRLIVAIDLKTIPRSYIIDVAYFATNLEDIDQFDFEGRNRPGFYKLDSEWGYVEKLNITHWMPLPGLPKQESSE